MVRAGDTVEIITPGDKLLGYRNIVTEVVTTPKGPIIMIKYGVVPGRYSVVPRTEADVRVLEGKNKVTNIESNINSLRTRTYFGARSFRGVERSQPEPFPTEPDRIGFGQPLKRVSNVWHRKGQPIESQPPEKPWVIKKREDVLPKGVLQTRKDLNQKIRQKRQGPGNWKFGTLFQRFRK